MFSSTTLLTTRGCEAWVGKGRVLSSSRPSASPSALFLSPDSRLGGWQHQQWTVQPGLDAGIQVYSTMPKAFYLYKLWCWRACWQFAVKGLRFLGGAFWWWRGGWRVCSRRAAPMLTYTPFNDLFLWKRREMRGDSKEGKYRGGNKDMERRKLIKQNRIKKIYQIAL